MSLLSPFTKSFLSSSGGGDVAREALLAFPKEELPTGLKNGVNKDFVLSETPIDGTLLIFLNGIEQTLEQYTLTGKTISFVEAPYADDDLTVNYFYGIAPKEELLEGDIDGENTEFLLSEIPATGTLLIFLNGVEQTLEQYSISGKNITFVEAPLEGDTLSAIYFYGATGITATPKEEIPSGAIDGDNKDFLLSQTPISGTLLVFLNGVEQAEVSQYTLSGRTISFILSPAEGDELSVNYFY